MKRKITTVVVGFAAATLIVGCGGSGGGSTPQTPSGNVEKGVGYYLDSAVAGADYICGTLEGVTQKDGKFFFEKGKDCKFLIADIPLRDVPADALVDNAKIVEDNLTVATFLQSIDNDGNASNGIEINEEVSKTLKTVFQEEGIKEVPHSNLDVIVDKIKQNVDSFEGEVKDTDDVLAHLTQTQTQVLKEFLSGKTAYTMVDGKEGTLESWSFGGSFDKIVWKELVGGNDTDTSIISDVNGLSFVVTDTDSSAKLTVMEQHGDYILVKIHMLSEVSDDETLKVYFDKAKAEAAFGVQQSANDPKALLAGKTLYTTIEAAEGTLESWTFDTAFGQITWRELVGGTDVDVSKISDITGSSFVVTDTDSSAKLTIVEKHTDYLLVRINMIYDENGPNNETETLKAYFDRDKAEAAFGVGTSGGNTNGIDYANYDTISFLYNVDPQFGSQTSDDTGHTTVKQLDTKKSCTDLGFTLYDTTEGSEYRALSRHYNNASGKLCSESDYSGVRDYSGSSNYVHLFKN